MFSRNVVVVAICLGSLVFGCFALSQERKLDARRERYGDPSLDGLERRIWELEKQVKFLNQEFESLRNEVHPNTRRSARPKPLADNVELRGSH